MNPPKDPPILNYQPPPPVHYGCGMIMLETMGGLLVSVVAFFAARSVARLFPAGLGLPVVISVFGLFLIFVIFLAYRRHPGYLFGFIIGSSFVGLLLTACGIRVMI